MNALQTTARRLTERGLQASPAQASGAPRAQRILVAVYEYGEFPEMLRVAVELSKLPQADVRLFFVASTYATLTRDTKLTVDSNLAWLDSKGREHREPAPETATAVAKPDSGARIRNRLKSAPLSDLLVVLRRVSSFKARNRELAAMLSAESPALVVVGQDAVGTELSFLIVAARRAGLPTLMVPFAMMNSAETLEYAAGRQDTHVAARLCNRALAFMYPRWSRVVHEHAVVRLPGSTALAVEMLGLAGGDPWVPCSEPVSLIACESSNAMRTFIGMGLPPDRLVVIGKPVHDRLSVAQAGASEMRARRFVQFGFDPERPLLVCGWPADVYSWRGSGAAVYPDYGRLARGWAQCLSRVRDQCGVNIVLSVHPKTTDAQIAEALSAGLPAVRGESDELIAICDVFTTLNGSSITAWALALRKPTVLFDCYKSGYDDFYGVAGCAIVDDEHSFVEALARLCSSKAARRAASAALDDVASHWAVLDGRACDRLRAEAVKLMGIEPKHRGSAA